MLVFVVGGAVLSAVAWNTAVDEWKAEPMSTSDESHKAADAYVFENAVGCVAAFLTGMTWVFVIVALDEQGLLSPTLSFALASPGVAAFPASFLLAITICLFNWPKVLVPPALRAERGLLRRGQTSPKK